MNLRLTTDYENEENDWGPVNLKTKPIQIILNRKGISFLKN